MVVPDKQRYVYWCDAVLNLIASRFDQGYDIGSSSHTWIQKHESVENNPHSSGTSCCTKMNVCEWSWKLEEG
jgi:hypothetical protein